MRPGFGNVAMRRWPVCNRRWPVTGFQPLGLLTAGLALLFAAGCRPSLPPASFAPGAATLVVNLEGLHNDRGTAIVSLFAGANGFPDDVGAALATSVAPIRSGRAVVTFSDLPYGEYAVSVLHDEDGDGLMATGLFGAPREGFGFSGYPDFRFGHPDYAEVSFLLVEPQREMTIAVRYETGRRQHQKEERAAESRRPQE